MSTQEESRSRTPDESTHNFTHLELCKSKFPALDWQARGNRFTGVMKRDRTLLIVEVWRYFNGSEERWNAGFRISNCNQHLANGKSVDFEEALNNLFLKLQALNGWMGEVVDGQE